MGSRLSTALIIYGVLASHAAFVAPAAKILTPVETLVTEWSRSGQLTKPVHLTYDGQLLTSDQETASAFTLEVFLVPSGALRIDFRLQNAAFSYVRSDTRAVVLSGKSLVYDSAPEDSLSLFSLSYPRSENDLTERLALLRAFSKDTLVAARQPKSHPDESLALREKVQELITPTGEVAYAFELPEQRHLLLHKSTLLPAGLGAMNPLERNQSLSFEATEIKTVEVPPGNAKLNYASTLILHSGSAHVTLTNKEINPDPKLDPKWVSIDKLVSLAKSGESVDQTREQRQLIDLLARFF